MGGVRMIIMELHTFFDKNIDYIRMNDDFDIREIILHQNNKKSLFINKKDVIALAKSFGLIIYEKEVNL